MSNEIQKINDGVSFNQMREQAALLVKSGFLPQSIKTAEQALTVMLTGKELNIGPMEALRSINVIYGRPCMSAQLILGLCYRTGQVEQATVEVETDKECIFVLKRKGQPAYRSIFTMEDARKLGLSERDNYKKQPKTMLRCRSISQACRVVFPDAICGLYIEEEIADDVEIKKVVDEIKVEVISEKVEQEKQEVAEEVKLLNDTDNNESKLHDIGEVDKLGAHYLVEPYNKFYPEATLLQIYETKTASGGPKGKPFLEMVATDLSKATANDKAAVKKFLEAIKAWEAQNK